MIAVLGVTVVNVTLSIRALALIVVTLALVL